MSQRTVTYSVPGHMVTRPKLIRLSSRRSIPSAKKASGGGPMTSDKSCLSIYPPFQQFSYLSHGLPIYLSLFFMDLNMYMYIYRGIVV